MCPFSLVQKLTEQRVQKLELRKARIAVAACLFGLATATAAADLRGFASNGPEGLLFFHACNGAQLSSQMVAVVDKTPDEALTAGTAAVREIMLDSGRPLYVEFRGDVAGKAITARQFHRALGPVETCGAAPKDGAAGARILAVGENPPWRFVMTAAGAKFERIGQKPIRFPAVPFAKAGEDGNVRILDAWSAQDGGTIRVEITEQMCSDGHSETAYGATAFVRVGSRTFEGCAARF
jgi:uncharacterized membrane protein